MEYFKILGYPNYEISKCGKIRRLPYKSTGTNTTKINYPKLELTKNGYYRICMINNNGIYKKVLFHRLLSECFIPNPENKPCVNHINGIRTDNRLENLEWVTYSENSKHGYNSNNRKNPIRKLTESQVLEIKDRLKNYKHGLGKQLSIEYNVSVFIISLIKNNKTYNLVNHVLIP